MILTVLAFLSCFVEIKRQRCGVEEGGGPTAGDRQVWCLKGAKVVKRIGTCRHSIMRISAPGGLASMQEGDSRSVARGRVGVGVTRTWTIEALFSHRHQVVRVQALHKGTRLFHPALHVDRV